MRVRLPWQTPDGEGPSAVVAPDDEGPSAVVAPDDEEPSAVVTPDGEEPSAVAAPDGEEPSAAVAPDGEEPSAVVTPDGEEPSAVVAPDDEEPSAAATPNECDRQGRPRGPGSGKTAGNSWQMGRAKRSTGKSLLVGGKWMSNVARWRHATEIYVLSPSLRRRQRPRPWGHVFAAVFHVRIALKEIRPYAPEPSACPESFRADSSASGAAVRSADTLAFSPTSTRSSVIQPSVTGRPAREVPPFSVTAAANWFVTV